MKRRLLMTEEQPMSIRPVCWEGEGAAACLGIELQSGERHLFSYQHFINASLFPCANGVEILRICFSGHDVEIEGRGLRDLLFALQNFGVKWVRTVPSRYTKLAEKENEGILAIRITPAE